MNIKDITNSRKKLKSVPLRGFLQKETDDDLWVNDQGSTWIINKNDVVSQSDDENLSDSRFEGKAICVFIQDGAEILEVKPTKIDMSTRPITLGDPRKLPKIKGDKELIKLAKGWARHLGFNPGVSSEQTCTPWTTTCSWDTGDWGSDIQADDSSCD